MIPLISILLSACPASVPAGISGYLCSPVAAWFPLVMAGVIAIMFILVLIYALSPLLGRSDMRSWSVLKMYETLFSLLLILVFLVLATLLWTVNPVPAMKVVGLVPNIGTINCDYPSVNTIFALSQCDLYNFNQHVITTLNSEVFYFQILLVLPPSVKFELDIGNLLGYGVEDLGVSDTLALSPAPLLDFLSNIVKIIGTFLILAEVQLLLLEAAPLIFSIFLAIGLIARIFGVTRSFGGAMIAFAIGIGFVFPLMVTIGYGFIDVALSTVSSSFSPGLVWSVLSQAFIDAIFTGGGFGGFLGTLVYPLINVFGLMAIGVILVPFINFIVIDTFIIDFSSAVGERMDFMSLLTSIA